MNALGPIEEIIAIKPDLVLMNSYGDYGRVAKLRGAGIEVFDLGELRGLRTVINVAESLADLLGHAERGLKFSRAFQQRLGKVAAGLGTGPRRRAVYVAAIGPRLYGGAIGTSYHDVIEAAGLVDAAAERFRDWPQYSAEQLIAMAPELVVTKEGMGQVLCDFPGLDLLPACRDRSRLIELPAFLLDEPGPTMLDAAEALFAKAYPK